MLRPPPDKVRGVRTEPKAIGLTTFLETRRCCPHVNTVSYSNVYKGSSCPALHISYPLYFVYVSCLVPSIVSRRTFASASHEPTAGGICSHYVVYPTAKMSQIPPSRCGVITKTLQDSLLYLDNVTLARGFSTMQVRRHRPCPVDGCIYLLLVLIGSTTNT